MMITLLFCDNYSLNGNHITLKKLSYNNFWVEFLLKREIYLSFKSLKYSTWVLLLLVILN